MKAWSRVILLVAVVIAVIVIIIRNIDVSKNLLLVLLGFGAVILIHEFGHFIVAKLCGIKVEAFSIFMPPILFGIKKSEQGWRIRILPELLRHENKDSEDGLLGFTVGKSPGEGETEYRIGLIPLGGFVKMLGQEDVGPVKTNPDPRSFANKPALSRAAVLTAGVGFNVISAVIVYIIVFLVGINLPAPTVGGVLPGSPAEKAGLKGGDEIIEVAGKDGRLDFSDILMAGVLSAEGEEIPLKVRRNDGSIEDMNLTAELLPGAQFRSFGIERAYDLTIANVLPQDANKLYETTGLKPGDRIKAVNGVDVNSNWQFEQIVEKIFEPNVTLLAERKDPAGQAQLAEGRIAMAFPVPSQIADESEANLANVCGMIPRIKIAAVPKELTEWLKKKLRSKDRKDRLKTGDIIAAVGDINNPTYSELRELTKSYEDKKLPLTVIRSDSDGVQTRLTVIVVPRKDSDSGRVVIGIGTELDVEHPVVAKTITTGTLSEPVAVPRGATITAVDGVAVKSFFDIAGQLKKNAGQRVTIDWRLDDSNAGNATLEVGKKEQVVAAQAMPRHIVPFKYLERLYKADGPIDAMMMGYKRTRTFIIQTYVTLQRLIGGLVSAKELMGPVGILTFSYRIVAEQPLIYYAYFLGLISASIAVLNFLPLPPFDGGLVVLLLIEKIKGSPISIRTQEIIAYAAWGLVLTLLVYVTFNDVARLFRDLFGF